jgi:Basic region leucine zipper
MPRHMVNQMLGFSPIGIADATTNRSAIHATCSNQYLKFLTLTASIVFLMLMTCVIMTRTFRTTDVSRERNRVHAQKTRLRKKEQMQILQARAAELKTEQLQLKQIINEKNTATILVRLFAEGSPPDIASQDEDPIVEVVLRRPQEEIPDASNIPELPALILPGQHASKRIKANMQLSTDNCYSCSDLSLDGIDYELLGRDRSQCTAEELDLIRRERNRMHAKRTRDRKRIFTEKLAEICRQLEEENVLLHIHLKKIDPDYNYDPPLHNPTPSSSTQSSPKISPIARNKRSVSSASLISQSSEQPNKTNIIFDDQMKSSLLKAVEREFHEIGDISYSQGSEEVHPSPKRQRIVLA